MITTADENTWKFDRPVIFLGEWCRLYNRKHIWGGMDAIVAEPYGLKPSKRDSDYSKALILENKLFPEFIQLLNSHHGTKYSERFWIEKYFGRIFHKRLVTTHQKNHLMGDYLIDDRLKNGAGEFTGELLRYGVDWENDNSPNEYPTWDSILTKLL